MSLHLCTVQKGIKGRIGVVDPSVRLIRLQTDRTSPLPRFRCLYVPREMPPMYLYGIRAPILFIYNLHSDW